MGQITRITKQSNAAEAALALLQRDYPNYHPLIALARLAHDPKVTDHEDPRIEIDIHKAILPYVAPKLSSVEVKAEVDERRRVVITLFDEELTEDGRSVPVERQLTADRSEIVPLEVEDASYRQV